MWLSNSQRFVKVNEMRNFSFSIIVFKILSLSYIIIYITKLLLFQAIFDQLLSMDLIYCMMILKKSTLKFYKASEKNSLTETYLLECWNNARQKPVFIRKIQTKIVNKVLFTLKVTLFISGSRRIPTVKWVWLSCYLSTWNI